MRAYDRFVNEENDIQVECYDEFGGSVSSFKIGDKVPLSKINNDFEVSATYGEHYNIFDYTLSDTIILIRYGIFVSLKTIKTIKETEIKDILCIDKYGNELELKTKEEYIEFRNDQKLDQEIRIDFYKKICGDFDSFIGKPNTALNRKGIVDSVLAKLTGFNKGSSK